jgi:hypothetical protein
LTVQQTFLPVNSWKQISIPDRGSISTIALDTVFVDTLNHTTPVCQLVSNSNSKFVKAQLTGILLTLTPQPYLTGTTTISLKAAIGKRILTKTFDVQVKLSAPFQKVYMPDSSFRNLLRDKYGFTDLKEDYIVQDQADTLQSLIMNTPPVVATFTGIESFPNLTYLDIVRKLNTSGKIDLSSNTKLTQLRAEFVNFSDIVIDKLVNLETLSIFESSVDTLRLLTQKNLKSLGVTQGSLHYLDVSENTELTSLILFLSAGGVSTIDLSRNILLQRLFISECDLLTSLDISNNINLKNINLSYNSALISTYVWALPLPSDVTIQKDAINTLYKK